MNRKLILVMVKGGPKCGLIIGDKGSIGKNVTKKAQKDNRRSGARDKGFSHLT